MDEVGGMILLSIVVVMVSVVLLLTPNIKQSPWTVLHTGKVTSVKIIPATTFCSSSRIITFDGTYPVTLYDYQCPTVILVNKTYQILTIEGEGINRMVLVK